MPEKVYVILCDGVHVLVGSGGCSGRNSATRGGLHLPGGSRGSNETVEATAIRELREETGIDGQGFQFRTFNVPNIPNVHFAVATVGNVGALVSAFTRPQTTNQNDEPFDAICSLPITRINSNPDFSAQHKTDWFGKGLEHANTQGFLIKPKP